MKQSIISEAFPPQRSTLGVNSMNNLSQVRQQATRKTLQSRVHLKQSKTSICNLKRYCNTKPDRHLSYLLNPQHIIQEKTHTDTKTQIRASTGLGCGSSWDDNHGCCCPCTNPSFRTPLHPRHRSFGGRQHHLVPAWPRLPWAYPSNRHVHI